MLNTQSPKKPDTRVHPLVAWRSVQKLLKDPDATGEVFKIINALKGGSLTHARHTMQASDKGRALLRDKPSIIARLEDRDALRALPEGSLGRAYLHFMESEELSPQGLLDASAEAPQEFADPGSEYFDPEENWLGGRMRDIHDLYHVITGYGRDPLGEICVISFSNAQSHNRGIAFIVYMAQRRDAKSGKGRPVRDCVREAKANGASARWFASEPWEDLLAQPLEEVRARLGVPAPDLYRQTREAGGEAFSGAQRAQPVAA